MANYPSQEKRIRQDRARTKANKGVRSDAKTRVRRVREAIAAADVPAGDEAFARAAKALDKAASKGLVHPNNAARRKSRLARALNAAREQG